MSDTAAIKEPRLRLKRSAIESSIAAGRMTRERGDELLVDDGVPAEASCWIAYFQPVQPDDDRRAQVTVAEVFHADGRIERVALVPHAHEWELTIQGVMIGAVPRGQGQYAAACRQGWDHAERLARIWLS